MIYLNTTFRQNFFQVAVGIGITDIKNGVQDNVFRIVDTFKTNPYLQATGGLSLSASNFVTKTLHVAQTLTVILLHPVAI